MDEITRRMVQGVGFGGISLTMGAAGAGLATLVASDLSKVIAAMNVGAASGAAMGALTGLTFPPEKTADMVSKWLSTGSVSVGDFISYMASASSLLAAVAVGAHVANQVDLIDTSVSDVTRTAAAGLGGVAVGALITVGGAYTLAKSSKVAINTLARLRGSGENNAAPIQSERQGESRLHHLITRLSRSSGTTTTGGVHV
jgi:hypothetical protein